MSMYTFYLCGRGRVAPSFEALELGGGKTAPARALKLLGDHPGCAYVEVWEGDRPLVGRRGSAATAMAL